LIGGPVEKLYALGDVSGSALSGLSLYFAQFSVD